MFDTAVRSWVTGAAVIVGVMVVSLVARAVLADDDGWVDFLVLMVVWLGVVVWGGAGLLVALTTPIRRRSPRADGVVSGIAVALLVVGLALWAWVLAIAPWDL